MCLSSRLIWFQKIVIVIGSVTMRRLLNEVMAAGNAVHPISANHGQRSSMSVDVLRLTYGSNVSDVVFSLIMETKASASAAHVSNLMESKVHTCNNNCTNISTDWQLFCVTSLEMNTRWVNNFFWKCFSKFFLCVLSSLCFGCFT